MFRVLLSTAAITTLTAGLLATAPAAIASGGGADASASAAARNSGSCSGRSMWNLKAKPDNGRIQVEFEVDSNVVGQTWNVKITDNTVVVLQRQATTTAPSGSFTVSRVVRNRAGVDHFVARAANPKTGETCVGRVAL
ncbi:MAG TPA: hypothetical protein VFJ97_04775 [Dermatophilaceae bacterium]|nr:hypothetical protein [Dermatophilaceae bacterium]